MTDIQKVINFAAVDPSGLIVFEDDHEPQLSNPASTFGAKVIRTGAVVADDGISFEISEGHSQYVASFALDEALQDEPLRYYVKVEYGGDVFYLPRTTALTNSAVLVVGRYTNSYRIEQQFGVDSVHTWLAIDGYDEAVDYARRFYDFIFNAESEVDDALRDGGSEVPITGDVPPRIADVSTMLAGVRSYESRGIVDQGDDGAPKHRLSFYRKSAMDKLAAIRAGSLHVESDDAVRYPTVINSSNRRRSCGDSNTY